MAATKKFMFASRDAEDDRNMCFQVQAVKEEAGYDDLKAISCNETEMEKVIEVSESSNCMAGTLCCYKRRR